MKNPICRCKLSSEQGGVPGFKKHPDYLSMNLRCDESPLDLSCVQHDRARGGEQLFAYVAESEAECLLLCRDTRGCSHVVFDSGNSRCSARDANRDYVGVRGEVGVTTLRLSCDETHPLTPVASGGTWTWGFRIP